MTGYKQGPTRKRHRVAKGVALYKGVKNSPRRIIVTMTPDDWRCMSYLAEKRNVPMQQVMQDAIYAYCLPIRADVPGVPKED